MSVKKTEFMIIRNTQLLKDLVSIIISYMSFCVDCNRYVQNEYYCNCGKIRCNLHQHNISYRPGTINCNNVLCYRTNKNILTCAFKYSEHDICTNVIKYGNEYEIQYCRSHIN